MVLDTLLTVLVGFVVVLLGAYIGTLRALRVYFDPDANTLFLPYDEDPPNVR
jgi:hypothetical protein